MKKLFWLTMVLLAVPFTWGQNPPSGPKGPPLADQGFTEAEAKTIDADLKKWEQANREWDADLQVLEAQRHRGMVRETLDKAELEKLFRAQYDLFLKRDLARIDLVIQWRTKYGMEKSRFLEGRLRGPQGPQGQPGQPGQPNPMDPPGQPSQPQGPAPKKP